MSETEDTRCANPRELDGREVPALVAELAVLKKRLNEAVELADHYTGGLWPHEVNSVASEFLKILRPECVRCGHEKPCPEHNKGL